MKRYRWNKAKLLHNLGVLVTAAAWAAINVWILYQWILSA